MWGTALPVVEALALALALALAVEVGGKATYDSV